MSRFPCLFLPLLLTGGACDGPCDEDGAPAWYQDADGDGYAAFLDPVRACWAPGADWVAEVAAEPDCDDGDEDVHPGVEETCDGVDQDCDGEVDEGDAVDALTWYQDADGDGWGDAAAPVRACAPGSGQVADATDCDDTDSATHPEATELWNGLDDDCDDLVDDMPIIAVAAGLLEGDAPHQRAGTGLAFGGDFLDGAVDSAGDDFVVLGGVEGPRPFWALDASAHAQEGSLALVAALVTEFEDPMEIESIRGPMRDLLADEEGEDDWLWTASIYDYHFGALLPHGAFSLDVLQSELTSVVSFGDTTLSVGLDAWIWDIIDAPCGEECRQPRISTGGFPNRDEHQTPWVVLGLDRHSDATMGSECGSLALFEGPFFLGTQNDDDASWIRHLVGEGSGHHLGTDLLMADFDGALSPEGNPSQDLLIGAGEYPGTGDALGAIYLVLAEDALAAPVTGYLGGTGVPYRVRVEGSVPGEALGALGTLVTPGDLDGDGLLDLAIPSPDTGRVYVLFAPSLRDQDDLELSDTEVVDDADLYAFSAQGTGFGAAVAAASDLDGDGMDDLAVGAPDAPGEDGTSLTGAVWVFSARDTWSETEPNGTEQAVLCLYGEHDGDGFGASLAAGGDLDEDGQGDLLIGAPGWDARWDLGYETDEGRVYTLLGRAP